MRCERGLTLSPDKTPIHYHRESFPERGRFLVLRTRNLKNMVDGLGVSDPQTLFLHNRIGLRGTIRMTPGNEAHPEQPVPTNYGSVFFQKFLLEDTGFFTLPPPSVSCSGVREIMALIFWRCRDIPCIRDGFSGPGTSLIERV